MFSAFISDESNRRGISAAGADGDADSEEEVPVPYLFWAVVPFELMNLWWDACERARETAGK
jgi:hypothetical protein